MPRVSVCLSVWQQRSHMYNTALKSTSRPLAASQTYKYRTFFYLFFFPFPLVFGFFSLSFLFLFSASALYYIKFNSLLPRHEIFLFLCKKKGRGKKKNPNFPQSSPKASFFLKNQGCFSPGEGGGWKLNIKQCRQLRVYFGKLIVRLFWLLCVSA